MKVSFLVTFYNQEEFVNQALDSILAIRKPFDWEILVGDDGSSDGSAEAVLRYVEQYPDNIFLHTMPRDPEKKYNAVRRLGANKLNLLKHATGDFFCNLDGDDHYCDTEFVAQALDIFTKNPHLSVVAFGYKYVIDGIESHRVQLPVEGILGEREYLRNYYMSVGACVLRVFRDSERMEYINSMGYYDDNIIVANNLYYGGLYAVPKTVYAYRQTNCSIMTSMDAADQDVHNTQGYDIDVKLVSEENKPDVLQRYACSIIRLYLNRNRIKDKLAQNRYTMYMNECAEIPDSLTYRILTYGEADKNLRHCTDRIVLPLMMRNWKFTIKTLIKMTFE